MELTQADHLLQSELEGGKNQTNENELGSLPAHVLAKRLHTQTAALIALLNEETDYIRTQDIDAVNHLFTRKQALTTDLSHTSARFKQMVPLLQAKQPDLLTLIKAQQREFRAAVDKNQMALDAMRSVSERILEMIADKMSPKNTKTNVYNGAGSLTNSPNTGNNHLQINQKF